MKRNLAVFVASLLCINMSCKQERNSVSGERIGNLYISDVAPNPGTRITFKYFPDSNIEQPPQAIMVTLIGENSYASDVPIEPSEKNWEGQIDIPDSAQAIALNFKVNNEYDTNNDKGYIFRLKNEKGKPVAGSKSSVGIFLLGWGNSIYGINADKDSIMSLIAQDLEIMPELKTQFELNYPGVLMQHDPDEAKRYISERIKIYENKESLTSENYEALVYLYGLNGHTSKMDSIKEEGIARYPKGVLAQKEIYNEFWTFQNLDDKGILVNQFERKFGKESVLYEIMVRNVALAYGEKGDYEKMRELANGIGNETTTILLMNNLLWTTAQEGKDLEIVLQLTEDNIKTIQNHISDVEGPPHYSKEQYSDYLKGIQADLFQTSALVNYRNGNFPNAIKFQERALDGNSGVRATTRYVKYLFESDDFPRVIAKSEQFIAESESTAEMEEYLKEAYLKVNGSLDGYSDYYNELKGTAKSSIKETLLRNKLNKKAPDFTLRDLEGNMVDLESLRGKTVFLDFWATWCGPCKASFPALKIASEKFSDVPDVEFFFINTMENSQGRHDIVEDFIKDNQYPFHVLFDEPKEENPNTFKVAEDFGITGIPAKIIIGPKGNVLFHHVGFDGNDSKLIDEIEVMIEIARDAGVD